MTFFQILLLLVPIALIGTAIYWDYRACKRQYEREEQMRAVMEAAFEKAGWGGSPKPKKQRHLRLVVNNE